MKRKTWILKPLALSVLLSLNGYAIASDSVTYYSDNQNDRVVAFDPAEMSIKSVIPTKGSKPYPIGKANDKTSYVSTRDSFSIDVLSNFDVINGTVNKKTIRKIQLKHSPRSFAYGPARGITVVAGNSDPWATLLLPTNPGNSAVQRLYKEPKGPYNIDGTSDENYGGNTSSGHPLCVQDELIILLNRTNRTISLFSINQEGDTPLDTLNLANLEAEESINDPDIQPGSTLSSAHHIARSPKEREKVYFASLEGSFNSSGTLEPGGVLKFKIVGEELEVVDYLPTEGAVHHLDITSDGEYVLQGTTEDGTGKLYVLNAGADADSPMSVARVIGAGKGAGHVFSSDKSKLAIVTNHADKFLTVIDMDHNDDGNIDTPSTWTTAEAWIPRGATSDDPGNIGRDSTRAGSQKFQAHTASVSGIDPQEQYYYGSAAADGIFYRIDLENLYKYDNPDDDFPSEDMLDAEAELGDSYLIQGDYNWNEPSGAMGGMD
ncbi:MAG: hypothetical protein U9N50_00030 [Pseudomonadota bacterium]|nr:hypothetical protein [Pseudomonadota bacterium]